MDVEIELVNKGTEEEEKETGATVVDPKEVNGTIAGATAAIVVDDDNKDGDTCDDKNGFTTATGDAIADDSHEEDQFIAPDVITGHDKVGATKLT